MIEVHIYAFILFRLSRVWPFTIPQFTRTFVRRNLLNIQLNISEYWSFEQIHFCFLTLDENQDRFILKTWHFIVICLRWALRVLTYFCETLRHYRIANSRGRSFIKGIGFLNLNLKIAPSSLLVTLCLETEILSMKATAYARANSSKPMAKIAFKFTDLQVF